MTELHDTTSLHETTVQRAEELADALKPTRQRGPRVNSKVTVEQVHIDLLRAAHKAQRPGERLVLVSATEVHLIPR